MFLCSEEHLIFTKTPLSFHIWKNIFMFPYFEELGTFPYSEGHSLVCFRILQEYLCFSTLNVFDRFDANRHVHVCVCMRVSTHAWLLQGMKRSVCSSRTIWGVPTCLLGPVWFCSNAHWCSLSMYMRTRFQSLFFSQNVRRGESLKGEGCERRGKALHL